jgi:hypothetical protein
MAAESVGVSKVLIELDSSTEKLKCGFMFFLQAVAVADHAPCLWGEKRLFKCKVAQMGELVLLLQVPEASGVVLKTFKTIWFNFGHLLKRVHRILVLRLLKETPSNLPLDPSCFALLVGQLLVLLFSFSALVYALKFKCFAYKPHEIAQRITCIL